MQKKSVFSIPLEQQGVGFKLVVAGFLQGDMTVHDSYGKILPKSILILG